MKVIGVTGRLGSGKSFIASELSFNHPNSYVLEIDYIRNKLFKTSKAADAVGLRSKIANAFEISVTSEQLWLDYPQFYQKLFSSSRNVALCAEIMTPYIHKRVKKELSALKKKNIERVYLPWAYLIEHGYLPFVNEVVFVICNEDTVLYRAQFSPHFNPEEAKRRRTVEPSDEKRLLTLDKENIPYKVIDNNISMAEHIGKRSFINE